MDDWSTSQESLYDSLFSNIPYEVDDPEAERLFDFAFFEGLGGLEFEYAVDEFEMYMWENYGIELDQDFWDDFKEWYDSQ